MKCVAGRIGLLFSLAVLIASAPWAFSADKVNAIQVTGSGVPASAWTAGQIEKEFASDFKTVQFTSHGQQHSAKCVALVALLKRAGVPTDMKMGPKMDPKSKNYPLRLTVTVTGRDGYAASFSLGELLPDVGHTDAWLAVELDGQPLAEADGPARLIVPSDKLPARWVREVATITIVDGSATTTQPK